MGSVLETAGGLGAKSRNEERCASLQQRDLFRNIDINPLQSKHECLFCLLATSSGAASNVLQKVCYQSFFYSLRHVILPGGQARHLRLFKGSTWLTARRERWARRRFKASSAGFSFSPMISDLPETGYRGPGGWTASWDRFGSRHVPPGSGGKEPPTH